jgi:hypothetical protein
LLHSDSGSNIQISLRRKGRNFSFPFTLTHYNLYANHCTITPFPLQCAIETLPLSYLDWFSVWVRDRDTWLPSLPSQTLLFHIPNPQSIGYLVFLCRNEPLPCLLPFNISTACRIVRARHFRPAVRQLPGRPSTVLDTDFIESSGQH